MLIAFVLWSSLALSPLYEVVLERKLKVMHRDEKPHIVEIFRYRKMDDSSWWEKPPPIFFGRRHVLSCRSFAPARTPLRTRAWIRTATKVLKSGDSLSLRVQTYDEPETRRLIGDLVGVQDDSQRREYMP